jgi:hypothetical protein
MTSPETNDITTLTVAHAKALVEAYSDKTYPDDSLYLDGLVTLSATVAQVLANHRGRLSLNGLGLISDGVASSLGEHYGDLSLNGLTDVSTDVARALAVSPLLTLEKKIHGRWAGWPIPHACHTAENEKTRKRAG